MSASDIIVALVFLSFLLCMALTEERFPPYR